MDNYILPLQISYYMNEMFWNVQHWRNYFYGRRIVRLKI